MLPLADIVETSRYLGRLLEARPALAAEVEASLDQPVGAGELSTWLDAQPLTEANLKPVLRQLKQRGSTPAVVRNRAAGIRFLFEVTFGKVPEVMLEILEEGGLVPYIKKYGDFKL